MGVTRANELVSVIIPCYNSEKYLAECLDSVLNQTYRNIEIICVNDGSTDGTTEILESYRQRYAEVIRVFSGQRKGAPAARNTGFAHSRGNFIQFLDSDDVIAPTKISNQLDGFTESVDFVVSDREQRDVTLSQVIKSFTFHDIEQHPLETAFTQIIITSNPLYRRQMVEKTGGYTETLAGAQDWEFHLRAVLKECRVVYVPGVFLISRIVPGSVSSNWKKISILAAVIILQNETVLFSNHGFTRKCRKHACRIGLDSAIFTHDKKLSKTLVNCVQKWSEGNFDFIGNRLKKILVAMAGLKTLVFAERIIRTKTKVSVPGTV